MCTEVFELCCFFKQKRAYEMRISDWSSDVCSSDLAGIDAVGRHRATVEGGQVGSREAQLAAALIPGDYRSPDRDRTAQGLGCAGHVTGCQAGAHIGGGPDLRTTVQIDALGGEAP